MKQGIEKINEIRSNLMVELDKAKTLLKICQDEEATGEMKKSELGTLSLIAYELVCSSVEMTKNIGAALMEMP